MYPSQFPVGFKEIRLQELPSSCFRVVQCFFPPFTFGLTRLNIVPSMYPLFRKNPISKNLPILAATSNINQIAASYDPTRSAKKPIPVLPPALESACVSVLHTVTSQLGGQIRQEDLPATKDPSSGQSIKSSLPERGRRHQC